MAEDCEQVAKVAPRRPGLVAQMPFGQQMERRILPPAGKHFLVKRPIQLIDGGGRASLPGGQNPGIKLVPVGYRLAAAASPDGLLPSLTPIKGAIMLRAAVSSS